MTFYLILLVIMLSVGITCFWCGWFAYRARFWVYLSYYQREAQQAKRFIAKLREDNQQPKTSN